MLKIYIEKFRWIGFFISIAIIVLQIAIMPKPQVSTNFEVYFEENDPDLLTYQNIIGEFPREANVVFLVHDKSSANVANSDAFEAVRMLTHFAENDPRIETVSSIYTYEEVIADNDEIHTQRIVEGTVSNREVASLISKFKNDDSITGRLISKNSKILIVSARLYEKPKDARSLLEATKKYRSIASDIDRKFPGVDVLVTGLIPLEGTLFEIMIKDGSTLIPLVFLFILGALYFFLRSISAVAITLFISLLSTLSSFTLVPWMGVVFNDVNISAALVIITIATADCIHVLMAILNRGEDFNKHDRKVNIVREAVLKKFYPLLMTTITTMVGFLFFMFSPSPPIQQFGLISSIGVGFAFIYVFTILIPLSISFPVTKAKPPSVHILITNFLVKMNGFFSRKIVSILSVLLCLLISLLAFTNVLEDDIVEYLDESTEVREGVNLAQGQLSGMQFIDVVLDSVSSDSIVRPEIINAGELLSSWMLSHHSFTVVDSLPLSLKKLNIKLNNNQSIELPQTQEGLSELLFMLELVSKEQSMNDLINTNRSQIKIRGYLPAMNSREIIALDKELKEFIKNIKIPEGANVYTSGPTLMFSYLGEKNLSSIFLSSIVFLVVVTVLMTVFLRSVKFGMLSIVPNLIPIMIVFGLWAIFQGSLNLASVAVITAILGLVIDDTIHVMWHYVSLIRKKETHLKAVRTIYEFLSPALFTTSMSFAIGFMILAQSDFEPNANMGILVSLSVIVAYFFDLLVLPQLLNFKTINTKNRWFR